jgi:hypothetical protein
VLAATKHHQHSENQDYMKLFGKHRAKVQNLRQSITVNMTQLLSGSTSLNSLELINNFVSLKNEKITYKI